jgi:hypothetical protein
MTNEQDPKQADTSAENEATKKAAAAVRASGLESIDPRYRGPTLNEGLRAYTATIESLMSEPLKAAYFRSSLV